MVEATQFRFTLTEIAEILVKQQGIHEGRWLLGMDLGFGAATLGGSPEICFPTGVVQVSAITLSAAPDDAPDRLAGLIDAAQVNPKPRR